MGQPLTLPRYQRLARWRSLIKLKHVLLALPFLVGESVNYYVVGPGYTSLANPGVLEQVAERRIENGWGLTEDVDLTAYSLLGAVADCKSLGHGGYLVTEKEVKSILIVDCEADVHRGDMDRKKLIVDINDKELVHQEAYLVLWRAR